MNWEFKVAVVGLGVALCGLLLGLTLLALAAGRLIEDCITSGC